MLIMTELDREVEGPKEFMIIGDKRGEMDNEEGRSGGDVGSRWVYLVNTNGINLTYSPQSQILTEGLNLIGAI